MLPICCNFQLSAMPLKRWLHGRMSYGTIENLKLRPLYCYRWEGI
jgi:hypothetical protein